MTFIDNAVASAIPTLSSDIASSYVARHEARLELLASPEIVPGGEQELKNSLELVERLRCRLSQIGIDRHSFVVVIGGGAVLDLIGYVAACPIAACAMSACRPPCWRRTIRASASRTASTPSGKELLGTFAPPFAVLTDSDFLPLSRAIAPAWPRP